ncbi:MAG TPA: hypothetical protein VL625_00780 [Patescibacteria group bacterium]|nr:hypothetical protein [Patescibacteria group bacterium]
MLKLRKNTSLPLGAAFTAGVLMSSGSANAAGGNDFSSIATNIQLSVSSLPGLLTALAYLFGILIGVLGILKIKDHVENPSNTPLKDGAIRLAAGGALFALPIIYEAMVNTSGNNGNTTTAASLNKGRFNVQ